MMREIMLLTRLELRNVCGFNKFRHSRDKKYRRRYLSLGAVWLLLGLMMLFYVGGLSFGLCMLGLETIVPACLTVIASLLIFFFGFFKAAGTLFSTRGYDMLCALPLNPGAILGARFLCLYLENLCFGLLVMVPGCVVYGWCVRPGMGFYLSMVVGALFLPMIPLGISAGVSTCIRALAARMKHKTLVETVLTLVFVLVVLVCSMGTGTMTEHMTAEMLGNLAAAAGDLMENIYPPALWLGNAAARGAYPGLVWFVLASLLAAGVVYFPAARWFHPICRRMQETSATHDYQMGQLRGNSLGKALYVREAKRYFSSTIYVTNTLVGPIMGCILAGAVFFTGPEALQEMIPGVNVAGLLPFAVAAVFTMMNTTSVSISMEGKEFWILKSLPLSTKAVLDSKILLNLSLMAPFYVAAQVFLGLALKPTGMEVLWMLGIPAVLILFSVVLGIYVNLKLPKLDWEMEGTVVKQSASAAIGGMGGPLLALLLGVVAALAPAFLQNTLKILLCAALLAATAILYRNAIRTHLRSL